MAIGSPSTRGLDNTKTMPGYGGTTRIDFTSAPKPKPKPKNPLDSVLGGLKLGGIGGFTGGGAGPKQKKANPGPMKPTSTPSAPAPGAGGGLTVATQTNPQLDTLIGDYSTHRAGLAAGSDLEATQALQRQRDSISGMAKEFGENSAQRGIYGSGAAAQDLGNRVLKPGMESMGRLNADLTSDARRQQLAALQGQGSLVGQQANLSQGQQRLGLDTWRAQQDASLGQAQLAANRENQNFSQLMALAGLINDTFTGF